MKLRVRRTVVVIGISLLLAALIPGYLRIFVIAGDSDSPSLATGDRVFVSLAAYDLRFPYSGHRLARLADPGAGDLALIRLSDGRLIVKRITAGPGTRIAMRENHLMIDGVSLEYSALTPQDKAAISSGNLGPVVEIERGNGPDVIISFGRGGSISSFEEMVVPEGHYFVLGSNRDASLDSRQFGPLPRERILGKIVGRKKSLD